MNKPVVLNTLLGRPNEFFSKKFFEQYEVRPNPYRRGLTKEELIKEIKDVNVTIAAIEPYNKEVYEVAKKLQLVARYGVGYDSVNVPEATKFGIFVTNLPGINSETVAEGAVSLIFAVTRGIVQQVFKSIYMAGRCFWPNNRHWYRLRLLLFR
jgi:phosphoglycerate dehydrogenase-like enzyme